jgi:hypothetical protein
MTSLCAAALTDALLDANLDDTVRCRLARVFAVCVSQRAADGLVLGLDASCNRAQAAPPMRMIGSSGFYRVASAF